jgi:hypothetical protein
MYRSLAQGFNVHAPLENLIPKAPNIDTLDQPNILSLCQKHHLYLQWKKTSRILNPGIMRNWQTSEFISMNCPFAIPWFANCVETVSIQLRLNCEPSQL